MFYIDIRKTFIYNNDKYSSKRSENNLPSIKQSVETSVINDKGELVIDILPRLKPWDSLDSGSIIQPYRLKYSHSIQDLC